MCDRSHLFILNRCSHHHNIVSVNPSFGIFMTPANDDDNDDDDDVDDVPKNISKFLFFFFFFLMNVGSARGCLNVHGSMTSQSVNFKLTIKSHTSLVALPETQPSSFLLNSL